jgi:hypothetical protein
MNPLILRELAKEFFPFIFLVEYEFPRAMTETILQLTYVNVLFAVKLDNERAFPRHFQDFLEFWKLSNKIDGSLAENGEY